MRAPVPYHFDNCWCNVLLLFVYIPFPIRVRHIYGYICRLSWQSLVNISQSTGCFMMLVAMVTSGSKQKGKQEGEGIPDTSGWLPLCSVLNFVNRTICVCRHGVVYICGYVSIGHNVSFWASLLYVFSLYFQQVFQNKLSIFSFLCYRDMHVSAAFVQGEWMS